MIHSLFHHERHTLTYAEYGDPSGFPILIQHGLIASIRDAALFNRLSDLGTRLICIARPGYGASTPYEMDDVAEWGSLAGLVADALKLERFDVLGTSSGAPYSYAIGARLPERTRTIFILSGIPALFDARVAAHWPFEIKKDAAIPEMQKLAFELFFAGQSPEELDNDAARDAMANHCFGLALDFCIRGRDWGFKLAEVEPPVVMRHSRADGAVPFAAAKLTAQMLPHCRFDVRETDPHFSQEVVDDFITTLMAPHYPGR